MKVDKIPYDMGFKVGDDLREYPDDPELMKKGILFLQDKMAKNDIDELHTAALASQVGVYLRILGELEESEQMLIQAHSTFSELKRELQILQTEIRLGVTFQWKSNYKKSEDMYRQVLKKISQSENAKAQKFEDFAYQHLGKLKFEQQQYNDALEFFTKALELRLIKGELGLIESTQYAIEVARQFCE